MTGPYKHRMARIQQPQHTHKPAYCAIANVRIYRVAHAGVEHQNIGIF